MEKIKYSKISLFQAVKRSCLGVDIFTELKNQSPVRTILHLLMMSLISAILIIVVGAKQFSEQVSDKFDILTAHFGELNYQSDGIYPSKNFDKTYDCLLSDFVKIVYTPLNEKININKSLPTGLTYFWSPKGIFMVGKNEDKSSYTLSFMDNIKNFSMKFVGEEEDVNQLIEEQLTLCGDNDYTRVPKITIETVTTIYKYLLLFSFWLQYFGMLIFVSLFFAFFYFITGVTKRSHMSFREFFAISIYAGFPPMLVSALFAGLDLPFIQYNTVFSFGWLIYLLVILSSLLKSSTKNN